MGATLVGLALAHWTHVSDRAFRVLIRMALTALDEPKGDRPAATYFAGRELLATALRSEKASERSRNRTVALVVAELLEVGAIERADSGRTGHNAVYRLTLDTVKAARKDPDQGGEFSHPQGGQISHPQGGQFSHPRVAKFATPRNHEEPIEELLEERRVVLTTTSHPPRATSKQPAPVISMSPWRSRRDAAQDEIEKAGAAHAARVAAHQARLAEEA